MYGMMSAYPHRSTVPFPVFAAATVFFFFSALSAADSVGFVPYFIDGTAPASRVAVADLPMLGEGVAPVSAVTALPTHIAISAINLDLPVQNPQTRDIALLDTVLEKGPARYADSARLGEDGNVLIFAHSSHLPIVHNQMFRAFNDVPELIAGDEIALTGDDGATYLYRVTSVRKADANSAVIDLSKTQGKKLTLVTCDTLTGKSARFIVEAAFVRSS